MSYNSWAKTWFYFWLAMAGQKVVATMNEKGEADWKIVGV